MAAAPVIPVGLWGTQHRWPKSGLTFSPPARPTVAVVYGEPIRHEGDPKRRPDVQALTDRIMDDIAGLVAQARATAPSRRRTALPGRAQRDDPPRSPSLSPLPQLARRFVVARTGWRHVAHHVRRVENLRLHIEPLRSRSLGLIGRLAAKDRDQLVEAISTLGPGGPITLDFEGVTSIDEGGMEALRLAIIKARDMGEVVLTLVVPSSGVVDELRAGGLDEDPMILLEIVEP